jgi:hypothetical protein
MNRKSILAITLAASLGASLTAVAENAELNPFVPLGTDMGPELVGGACYDFYPVTLNAFQGYDSLMAISCIRFGTDTNPCVYDLYILPSGTTSWNVSLDNLLPARALEFFDMSAFGIPLNRVAQVWIQDGSAGGDGFMATRHFIFKGDNFTADKPVSNCE